MTWFASSANATEAAKEHYLMFLAASLDFSSGIVRFWSGIGDLSIGGFTYIGAGELVSVSMPTDGVQLVAERKTYRLSGVDPTIIDESDIDDSFGRDIVEYFGFLNPETHALIDTPEINWEGRIDSIRRVDGREPIIEVNGEHRMVFINRPDGWRYTHEHQQLFFAGDLGWDQLAANESKDILWGGKRSIIGHVVRGRSLQPIYGD